MTSAYHAISKNEYVFGLQRIVPSAVDPSKNLPARTKLESFSDSMRLSL